VLYTNRKAALNDDDKFTIVHIWSAGILLLIAKLDKTEGCAFFFFENRERGQHLQAVKLIKVCIIMLSRVSI
jgi:hypothetical protein